MRFVCGIFVFGVTWILIGKSSETTISPAMWKQFMVSSVPRESIIFYIGKMHR